MSEEETSGTISGGRFRPLSMRLKVVGVGAVYFSCFFTLFIGSLVIVSQQSADIPGNGQTTNNTLTEEPSTDDTEQAPPQVPTATQLEIVWNRTHGGNSTESASSIIKTADGGFLVVGMMSGDIFLLKVNGEGEKTWEKSYDGVGIHGPCDVVQGDNGGYTVAGSAYPNGSSMSDAYFLKVDVEGNPVWNRTYGGSGEQVAASIVECGKGDCLAACWNNGQMYVVRVDPDGNLVWNRTYGPPINTWPGIVGAEDGTYLAWGCVGSSETYLLRLDDGGKTVWEKTVPGRLGTVVVPGLNGGLVGAGVDEGDISLLSMDNQGNQVWQKTYSRNGSDSVACIVDSGDGGFVVGGSASLKSKGPPTYEPLPVGGGYLLKVDGEGEPIWEKEYPFTETGMYRVDDIVRCGPAEFVAVGARPYDPETRWDLFLVKIVDKS